MKPRPYVKVQTDWCDTVLREWAQQLAHRPRERVAVFGSSTSFSVPIQKGGSATGKETARGVETRAPGKSKAPYGFVVEGLTGTAAKADRVVMRIAGVDTRCAWVLRAEYGLMPEVQPTADTRQKANYVGAYVDGQHWPASAYADRLTRALQMFAVGYLCAVG